MEDSSFATPFKSDEKIEERPDVTSSSANQEPYSKLFEEAPTEEPEPEPEEVMAETTTTTTTTTTPPPPLPGVIFATKKNTTVIIPARTRVVPISSSVSTTWSPVYLIGLIVAIVLLLIILIFIFMSVGGGNKIHTQQKTTATITPATPQEMQTLRVYHAERKHQEIMKKQNHQ